MRVFAKPVVVASKCLGFEATRYNGGIIHSDFVQKLKDFVEMKLVCPEVAIGLGVPRPPIRLVDQGEGPILYQPETGKDVTLAMKQHAREVIETVGVVDGFVLKAKSPSCGIHGVKVYPAGPKVMPRGKTAGMFGGAMATAFPDLAVEDEENMCNPPQREHFLTKIFLLADLREARRFGTVDALRCFHLRNRMLILLYSARTLERLGHLLKAANGPAEAVFDQYSALLMPSLRHMPRANSATTVLKAVFAPLAAHVTAREKQVFMKALTRFQEKQVPISVPIGLIRAYLARVENRDLESQSLLQPYPEELVEINESGSAR